MSRREVEVSGGGIFKIVGTVAVLVVAAIVFFSTYFTTGAYERGVVTSWGEFSHVAEPGLSFKVPFRDDVTFFPTDIQSLTPQKPVNTYTVDNQEVDVVFTVQYQLVPDRIRHIYENNREYKARLYSMTVDRIKAEMGRVNVQNVAENRGILRDRIKDVLTEDAAIFGIHVVDVQLNELMYTEDFRKAVNNAAVQKANIESVEYQKQQEKITAEKNEIAAKGLANAAREKARGDADARLLVAEAEAKSIRLKGEAEAAAIQAQTEALRANSALIELRRAERWDGKLPVNVYGSAPIPFMDVNKK